MRYGRVVTLTMASFALAAAASRAADPAPKYGNCPLTGVMPDYAASGPPAWRNWDALTFVVADGDDEKGIRLNGTVCTQDYDETAGKTEGSAIEIMENYKEALRQQGAEIKRDHTDNVVAHLAKDGKDIWIGVFASRDDSYGVRELVVEPFKRTLLPPSGNDYRLLGHMPGFVPLPPTKKHFDQFAFPTEGGDVAIRGALYIVQYEPPAKPPEREVTTLEVVENYRAALRDLNAEFLRDDPDSITARVDDHGQIVYFRIGEHEVVAVEEKPFQLTIQPPTADALKDQLDKEGRIALYVNFDFAKATLKPDAAPTIAQVVELLKRNADLKVSIEGYTDGVGGHDYNLKLSQDRAAAVVAAIVAAGIDGARLQSAGFGPDKPIAPNDTDEGRAKNRRVELVKAS